MNEQDFRFKDLRTAAASRPETAARDESGTPPDPAASVKTPVSLALAATNSPCCVQPEILRGDMDHSHADPQWLAANGYGSCQKEKEILTGQGSCGGAQ